MENEDDSLVQTAGCDGALQQEHLGILLQGQVHSSLPEELEVRPQLWAWLAGPSPTQFQSFKWVTPPLAGQDPSPQEGTPTKEGWKWGGSSAPLSSPSHLDVPAFILVGVSAVQNHKPLHNVAELAHQQGHHL